jgi:hypothetical protein
MHRERACLHTGTPRGADTVRALAVVDVALLHALQPRVAVQTRALAVHRRRAVPLPTGVPGAVSSRGPAGLLPPCG